MAGLDVLRRCELNYTHGWDTIGRPRALDFRARTFGEFGPSAEFIGRRGLWARQPNTSMPFESDMWNFVAAAEDQARSHEIASEIVMRLAPSRRDRSFSARCGPRRTDFWYMLYLLVLTFYVGPPLVHAALT